MVKLRLTTNMDLNRANRHVTNELSKMFTHEGYIPREGDRIQLYENSQVAVQSITWSGQANSRVLSDDDLEAEVYVGPPKGWSISEFHRVQDGLPRIPKEGKPKEGKL